ncbi:hypothetical protein ACFL08_04805 [Patescibacteria group bacterium]
MTSNKQLAYQTAKTLLLGFISKEMEFGSDDAEISFIVNAESIFTDMVKRLKKAKELRTNKDPGDSNSKDLVNNESQNLEDVYLKKCIDSGKNIDPLVIKDLTLIKLGFEGIELQID